MCGPSAPWRSGYAAACKAVYTGSIPVGASPGREADVTPASRPVSPCRTQANPGGDMTGTTRIPKAEMTGVRAAVMKRMARRMLGEVPDGLAVGWHNRKVLFFGFGLGRKSQKWHECDESLKSFAHMAVASLVGCSACLDLGYFQAHDQGLDMTKAREVPRWRESGAFTPARARRHGVRRGDVADAAHGDRRAVGQSCSTSSALPALVELTAYIALANLYSPDEHRDGHRVPGPRGALRPAAAAPCLVKRHERRPVRHPRQPALHGRLRDARLRRRRRGRGPGDLASLGGRRPAPTCATRAPTSSGSSPGRR